MANSISVYSAVTQAKTFLVDFPKDKLLQDIFFESTDEDNFCTKEVMFDFDDPDLGVCPMVSKGYKDQNVLTWRASSVEPPRCALEVAIDPTDADRRIFESLCYQANGNRSQAIQDYKRILASRCAERVARKIETLCASVLMHNAIVGSMPKSPSDSTPVPVEIRYYSEETGNQQRYLPATAWGQNGATPYKDVCAMTDALSVHGGNPEVLLISPEAYALLSADNDYKAFFETYHSSQSVLTGEDYRGGRLVARCTFGGYPLDVVVYSGSYKDDNNNVIRFLEKGFVCVLSRHVGHVLAGGVCLCEPSAVIAEDIDDSTFKQMRGKIIMSQFVDLNTQTVKLRAESRPLPAPWKAWQWITMDAQNSNSISGGTQGAVISVDFDSEIEGATLPADLTNQLGGSKISIADASKQGETFDGWYLNGVKLVKDSDNKYTLPYVDCVLEARFA